MRILNFNALKFVDYSCALQRDILVHGRLYVSPGYLCFYANIFGWETSVSGILQKKLHLIMRHIFQSR